jgi:glycerol-3-phosphate dehydrogenase (NAD(P)+)
MPKAVTILGAGVMGSAMTPVFADRGMDVRLVGTHLDRAIIDEVKATGRHPRLAATLPAAVKPFHHEDFAKALGQDSDLILLGVSSAGVTWAIDRLVDTLKKPIPVVMITKGMAPRAADLGTLPDLVQAEVEDRCGFRIPVAAIGGPCIAGELAVRRPTGTVIVSRDLGLAARLSEAFATDYYLPRPSLDMVGVEICAAFKNFFAIAVGWAHGRLDVLPEAENKARNNNAAAIIFDQAVREMLELVRALGGSAESVWGMPGVGDLYVTCQAGRNSRLGNHMGRGLTYRDVKAGPMKDDTVEGAELGLAVAASLEAMVKARKLSRERLPLTFALLDALTKATAFTPPLGHFHRSG